MAAKVEIAKAQASYRDVTRRKEEIRAESEERRTAINVVESTVTQVASDLEAEIEVREDQISALNGQVASVSDLTTTNATAISAVAERTTVLEAQVQSPTTGLLSRAAACYAAHASAWNRIPVSREAYRMSDARRDRVGWPWALSWWKPKSARRDLIRAAALIVAEIERLDRSNERAGRQCPVCLDALLDEDDCATDIDMGTCHAGCLEGAPVVNLETGEEVRDAVPATFKFATPLPAALAS